MFKISIDSAPTAIKDFFISNDTLHCYNTRQKYNLRQRVAKREYMYKNFSFIGVYVWNHIQSKTTINTLTSYNTFKYTLNNIFSSMI